MLRMSHNQVNGNVELTKELDFWNFSYYINLGRGNNQHQIRPWEISEVDMEFSRGSPVLRI